MDPDADVNLLSRLFVCIVGAELGVNLLGALHSVDHGGRVHQKGIANRLDDRAVMLGNCLLNDVVMDLQQPQRAGFIAAHVTAKADDVGEHDRGQPSIL